MAIQPALDDAKANPGHDRVLIGAGVWTTNNAADDDVTIEGSGSGTVLTQASYGAAAGYPFTLAVAGTGAAVRNLRIALPAGTQPRGLKLTDGAVADNVTIDGAGAIHALGVHASAGARFSGTIDLPSGNIGADLGADSEIVDARIAGASALHVQAGVSTAIVRRSTLVGRGGDVVDSGSGALTLEDTLVDARSPGTTAAISTYAPSGTFLHTIDLRNVTVLGHGDDPQSTGIYAQSLAPGDHVKVTLRDGVVANFGSRALVRGGVGTADVGLDHVDVFPASAAQESGAGVLTSTDVTNADPGFAADGFTPTPGSPLIDTGTPGPLGSGESVLDLAGNPRVVAFGCGEPRRDVGAIEAISQGCQAGAPGSATPTADVPPTPVADAAAPHVTKLRIVRRRAVRFTLSEAARVTVRVTGAHRRPVVLRRAAKGGRVSLRLQRILRHGRYAIRVIAVDGAGNRSAPAVARTRI